MLREWDPTWQCTFKCVTAVKARMHHHNCAVGNTN